MIGAARSLSQRCSLARTRQSVLPTLAPRSILSLNWTDQGIRSVKGAPKRAEASKELARKVGVEIKEVYLTSGDNDLVIIVAGITNINGLLAFTLNQWAL